MARALAFGLATVLMLAGLAIGGLAVRTTARMAGSATASSLARPDPGGAKVRVGNTGSAGEEIVEEDPGSEDQDPSEWMRQYKLTERSGRTFHSRELSGKVHVVNFFFSACPTVCRMQTTAVQTLARQFGPQGVVFLSITCDPENDTPVALNLYARQFQADPAHWLFLTGDLTYLRRVGAEMYYLPVDKQTHSEALVVLDRAGEIRGRFNWKKEQELADMKRLLAELLAEDPPEAAG